MSISPDLLRSGFLGGKIKSIIEEKGLTITEVSNKIGSSRPTVNNLLNGRTSGTDNFFIKIMKGVGINDKDIKKIFRDADAEVFKYKYGEELNTLGDIDFDVALRKEYGKELDDETIGKIKSFIEHVKFLKKK